MFTVQTVALNHRIPSLAYSLQEQFHVNINKERLHEAGLPVGRWLKDVKEYLWQGKPDDFRFRVILYHEHHKEEREFVLGDVRERFVTMSRGQKLAYVVDARYDEENEAKVVDLAQGADIFTVKPRFWTAMPRRPASVTISPRDRPASWPGKPACANWSCFISRRATLALAITLRRKHSRHFEEAEGG